MLLILVIILISGCIKKSPVEIHNQDISGRITKDQVWSGTIHVTGDIDVIEGVTLTILPGTVVEVAAFSDDQHGGEDHPHDSPFPKDPDRIETQSTQIIIRGTLNAVGTADEMIIFTSDNENPTTYDWDGLNIFHGRLEYVIIEYSRYNNIQESSDVVISDSILRNMLECCIGIGHSKPVSPQILNNEIYNCGHEGIDLAGGSPLIKGNHFYVDNPEIQPDPSTGRTGIVLYRNVYPVIENNTFEKTFKALYFHYDSRNKEEPGKEIIVRDNVFKNNEVAINIYSNYPDVIVKENNKFIDNKEDEIDMR
ncbi:right-handed parallel beta-helix repeat-containing protein [Candidatus Woesearchaeota archaeon]|nr:right-handed parallel beta-helix repeat-containing protein [Candidatus Woesearchaeota archaeon]